MLENDSSLVNGSLNRSIQIQILIQILILILIQKNGSLLTVCLNRWAVTVVENRSLWWCRTERYRLNGSQGHATQRK